MIFYNTPHRMAPASSDEDSDLKILKLTQPVTWNLPVEENEYSSDGTGAVGSLNDYSFDGAGVGGSLNDYSSDGSGTAESLNEYSSDGAGAIG